MPDYATKLKRAARNDYPGFVQAVAGRYGHSPQNTRRLLDIATKLQAPSGEMIGKADIAVLRETHPNVDPNYIARIADEINAAPAGTRANLYIAALVADGAVIEGNFHEASAAYREVSALAEHNTTLAYSEELIARRGGTAGASPAWRPEPGSTRDIIERQFQTPGERRLAAAYESGDPEAEDVVRVALADRIDRATDDLERADSTRDALSASWDLSVGSDLAASDFGLGEPSS